MKKIYNSFFDETYYTETLSNGLKVVIFHKPEFLNTTCAFGTPYGALMIHQKYKGKNYHFHPGIAHFLEHKLFEAKGDDMMNVFSGLGASVNAFTTYKETVYYFSKTGKDIEEPLNLLLDFVQKLEISKKSVEKEKGIIEQEVSSYAQMPDTRLLQETYQALYHTYPLIYDIGGDKKSIYAISKQELEDCYHLNYHPSNMTLLITSPLDPKKIIKIVKDNQNKKSFIKEECPVLADKKEPNFVAKKRVQFKMPISMDKHVLAYKIPANFSNAKEAMKKEWCIRLYLECYFSYLNPSYQKWLDDKLINDYFGYEVDFDVHYANILFYIENDDSRVLPNLIKKTLQEDLCSNGLVEQLKRRYIGEMFDVFNDVESFDLGYIRDSLNGVSLFDSISTISKITLKDIKKAWNELDLSQESYISMRKK